ncbi:hypothetical protein DIR46_16575 [Massilia oculi]|uniref:Uncharacterized protein n=1 Tax=Massilia oculi TaxID=945844 RepID=A0A2S2DKJ2_9BURK|nr:hypothetical protein DIR46_16575 [Massilia oculi]
MKACVATSGSNFLRGVQAISEIGIMSVLQCCPVLMLDASNVFVEQIGRSCFGDSTCHVQHFDELRSECVQCYRADIFVAETSIDGHISMGLNCQ